MVSLLPSALILGAVALVAVSLSRRPSPALRTVERGAASRALAVTTALQGAHFAEEAIAGFPERLGSVFGLPAMPLAVFIAFNVVWLGIWAASVPGVRSGRRPALFAAWFLALAGMLNGVAHPLLALRSTSYFPGLWTAPVVAVAALWLWARLIRATVSST
jgi:hypothetical protein